MTSVKGRRVFLSGPMTGIANYNVEAFATAHAIVKECGAVSVYNPAIEYLRNNFENMTHEQCMRECLRTLTKPSLIHDDEPFYDLMVQLPEWENSEGALTEFAVAQACGIECVELWEVTADD